MSRIHPECLGSGHSDRSLAADVLVREEPDDEDEQDEEDDDNEEDDDEEGDDDGYSE
jgi:hypothetical protein